MSSLLIRLYTGDGNGRLAHMQEMAVAPDMVAWITPEFPVTRIEALLVMTDAEKAALSADQAGEIAELESKLDAVRGIVCPGHGEYEE